MKKKKLEKTFLENLEELPIVKNACERTGISRTTVYRWRNEDIKFRSKMDKAIKIGTQNINDITENQLLQLIKEKNWQAIKFWLTKRHKDYMSDEKLKEAIKRIEHLENKKERQGKIQMSNINTMKAIDLMRQLGILDAKDLDEKREVSPRVKELTMEDIFEKLEELSKAMFGEKYEL